MNWYAFSPAGTLLFKGAEPMDMGADHHASHLFPPPNRTIIGAIRTVVLLQNSISYKEYYEKKVPSEIISAIGEADDSAPFKLIGPLFLKDGQFFVPAPYSWFINKEDKEKKRVRIYRTQMLKSDLIKGGSERWAWVKQGPEELESLGGRWIQAEDLFSGQEMLSIFKPDDFYAIEPRTGIALNQNRRVREGHLYTFTHVRLKPAVALAFGLTADLPLSNEGFLRLGAEQRFGRYDKIKGPVFREQNSKHFHSLGLIQGSQKANDTLIATGKIQYIGGWDLKKGFHKPMQGFFPAGSVFSENIHSNCVQV